jgi:hypothetical protein
MLEVIDALAKNAAAMQWARDAREVGFVMPSSVKLLAPKTIWFSLSGGSQLPRISPCYAAISVREAGSPTVTTLEQRKRLRASFFLDSRHWTLWVHSCMRRKDPVPGRSPQKQSEAKHENLSL